VGNRSREEENAKNPASSYCVSVPASIHVLQEWSHGSHWDQPALLLSLLAIARISYFSMVAIKAATSLDAEFIAVLLALAFLGLLPALSVWLVAESAFLALDRHRPEAHLANVSSYGWASEGEPAGSRHITLAVVCDLAALQPVP
jgi:hypothetical protein